MKYHPNCDFYSIIWNFCFFYDYLVINGLKFAVFCGFKQTIHQIIPFKTAILENSTKYGILKTKKFYILKGKKKCTKIYMFATQLP